MVVVFDIVIMMIFMVAILRVKYLETLTLQDLKHGVFSIDDFTILVKDIPIPQELYHNNPELLAAMVVPHLEEVVRNEL